MTSPLFGNPRDALPLDLMRESISEGAIEETLRGLFPDEQLRGVFTPSDEVAEIAFALAQSVQGRKFFEWILDGTLRQPYRPTGSTLEETALNAARREGLNTPAEMILAAISRGERIVTARAPGARQ